MKYFTLKELTRSYVAASKGIANYPDDSAIERLNDLVNDVLDPLREMAGYPIIVTSGYRCPQLNRIIGGSASSQHVKGEAADIVASNPGTNGHLFELIGKHLLFDQLIWENGNDDNPAWVHVSFHKERNRREVLRYRNGHYERLA